MFKDFHYDPITGFLWRHKKNFSKVVGSPHKITGRLRVNVSGKVHYVHRICWYLYYGSFPEKEIDHINGLVTDNRICNLREASRQQNACNQGIHKNNNTGYKGVHRTKRSGYYSAKISFQKKHYWLGYFSTAEEAKEAYDKKARELFGEFNRK